MAGTPTQPRRARYDYRSDRYGALCLELASQGGAQQCFGAVLVRDGKVLTSGRNRRSQPGENEILGGGVDCSIHAEQVVVLEALKAGIDLTDAEIFVIGMALRGPQRGRASVRASDCDQQFSCLRCAKLVERLGIPVSIPLPSGWHRLEPTEVLASAEAFRAAKRSRVFTELAA